MNLVSIIIPCYNDAKYIEQSVQSALNQTYSNKEIIVIDDGSNSETKLILKKLEPKITKLITQVNQGQSTARNVGMKVAKGNFILVLDSDDYFEASFCEEAVSILTSFIDVKIVTSHLRRFKGKETIDIFVPLGGDISNFVLQNAATGSAMFRKNDALAIGGYDESMRKGLEDWEFYLRLLATGGLAKIIPKPYLNYRIRKNSTTSRANKVKIELLNYIYTKNKIIFLQHIDIYVASLLQKIEKEEKDKNKTYNKIDYKLGSLILKPFRFVRSIFKWIK